MVSKALVSAVAVKSFARKTNVWGDKKNNHNKRNKKKKLNPVYILKRVVLWNLMKVSNLLYIYYLQMTLK